MEYATPHPVAPPPKKAAPAARPRLAVKKVVPVQANVDALPLENTLRTFAAVRATTFRRRAAEMPPEVEQRWQWFMDEVETAAANDADGVEQQALGMFIRTRVMLEAEMEMDQRRYGKVAPELLARHKETAGLVHERIKLLREVSTGFALQERMQSNEPVTLHLPVQVMNLTSYFGQRRDPIHREQTRFHAGIDLAGAPGTLVAAAGPGIVAHSDWQGGSGNHVVVVHANGYRSHYSHLSKILVEPGMVVEDGTPLGLMGDTGRSTGPHLHFAVSHNGSFLDPLDALETPLTPEGPPVPRS